MTPPLSLFPSLFLRLPFPVPSALPLPPHPRVDQTQTQLEHARIGELEQSLLLEKAQAERLLRELADNRVTRLPPPPASALPRTPLGLLCLIIFSVLGCCPHCFFPFVPFLGGKWRVRHCLRSTDTDAFWGGGGLALWDFAPQPVPLAGNVLETLHRPPSPCVAMPRLGQLQKSGVSPERSASCGQSRRQPIPASLLPAGKVEAGGWGSSFSRLEGLKYGVRRGPLKNLGLEEEGCPQDMGFCVSPRCG